MQRETDRQKDIRMVNPLKKALVQKHLLKGMQVFSTNPAAIEILGLAGFDWVSIDMEHTPLSFETVAHLVRAADAAGVVPLVRVSHNDGIEIMHALDTGAAGVIIPHVSTAEDLTSAIRHARYPPDGDRGVCPIVRGARYGFGDWNSTYQEINRGVVVVPLVEEQAGVRNFDDMVQVDGADIYWLAVGDLSQSYNLPGASLEHPVLRQVAADLVGKATRAGKVMMATVSPKLDKSYAQFLADLGFRLLSFGADLSVFARACRQIAQDVSEIRASLLSK